MKYISSIISGGSGSVAGCTYSRNKSGNYIRNRSIPVNPQTIFQSAVRSAFGGLSQAWLTALTASQRSGWAAYAAAVSVPSFGGPIFLSGMNWYVAINTPRLQAGLARIDNAPTNQSGTTLTPITGMTWDVSDTEFDFNINGDDEWANVTGGVLFLYEGGPRNATRNFFKGPYRFVGTILGNTATPPSGAVTLNSNLVAAVGQRVYLRAVAQAVDGRMSVPQLLSTLAIA